MVKLDSNNNSKLNVLLAEDSAQDRELLRKAVERSEAPVNIFNVEDGSDAIEYLEGSGKYSDRFAYPMPDVLVLDLKMRELSGFDVLLWLREHPDCAVMPTVVLSGSGQEKDIQQAYALGANTYFEKPNSFVDFEALIDTVVRYWSLSRRPATPCAC